MAVLVDRLNQCNHKLKIREDSGGKQINVTTIKRWSTAEIRSGGLASPHHFGTTDEPLGVALTSVVTWYHPASATSAVNVSGTLEEHLLLESFHLLLSLNVERGTHRSIYRWG